MYLTEMMGGPMPHVRRVAAASKRFGRKETYLSQLKKQDAYLPPQPCINTLFDLCLETKISQPRVENLRF